MSNFKLLSVIVFCSLLGGAPITANTFVVTDESDYFYGKGVHAFFDRDYEGAVTVLLRAVEIRSSDPRSYYFLGLAYLRQDKTELAYQAFKQAALLEFSGRATRDYAVAESLRRVQGKERLRIEKIRSEERTNARIREQQRQEVRYGREGATGRDILWQSAPQNQVAGNFGNNAFGVKPINPINMAEENTDVRRGMPVYSVKSE